MKTLTVKKKEISIKDPSRLLIEDEVAPEDIEIVVVDASTISNIEELDFYLQYVNKLGQYGIEVLDKDYNDEDVKVIRANKERNGASLKKLLALMDDAHIVKTFKAIPYRSDRGLRFAL